MKHQNESGDYTVFGKIHEVIGFTEGKSVLIKGKTPFGGSLQDVTVEVPIEVLPEAFHTSVKVKASKAVFANHVLKVTVVDGKAVKTTVHVGKVPGVNAPRGIVVPMFETEDDRIAARTEELKQLPQKADQYSLRY